MYHYYHIVYFCVTEAITNVKMVDIASTLTVYLKDAKARVARKEQGIGPWNMWPRWQSQEQT